MMSCLLNVLRRILCCGEEDGRYGFNDTRNRGDYSLLPHDSSSQRHSFSQRKLPEAGASPSWKGSSPSPFPSSSSPRSSVISSVSEIKPPISTEPTKRSLEKPHQSSSSPLPSSCSATRTKSSTIGSISERKPPVSKEPWERSLEKPSSTGTRDRVKLSTTSSLSEKKPGSLIEPSKTSVQNSRSSITSPSPLPSFSSAVGTGVCVSSVSAEKKLLVSRRLLLEKPCETSSSSIFSPSPTIPSSKASVSPPPPAPPLKASPSSLTTKKLYTPSRKASPPSSPFKLPEPEKRSPGPTKIEQRIRYEIPRHLQEMIKRDTVPPVLKIPLSPATYADFFATLLYAEDFYLEKWSNYLLSEVTLELRHECAFQVNNSIKAKETNNNICIGEKDFVAFEIDSVPENRPYLLSRDFVKVRPSGEEVEPFKGILFRVVKSTTVLVEFADDFYKQHSPSKKYDVSFSFNRVCLKRFHQAVLAATDPLMHRILFPDPSSRTSSLKPSSVVPAYRSSSHGWLAVVSRILNLKGPLPYLIEGPLSETREGALSTTGALIQEAVLQINRNCSGSRILVCAPRNRTCDKLMKKWMLEIPKSKLFRANAAFRDYDHVPGDIIPACLYEGECFTCPSLLELQKFEVITSTFVSSFRLHTAGIEANHFTHIFLVDASSATEPETIVALANLVNSKTAIVITGSSKDTPSWVRSDMARMNGLKKSLFQRLLEREPYSKKDPMFITHIVLGGI